jgi:hypothetical protein
VYVYSEKYSKFVFGSHPKRKGEPTGMGGSQCPRKKKFQSFGSPMDWLVPMRGFLYQEGIKMR